jgi:c-di-GMP-binding flagellar brake protein YcgR
MRCNGGISFEYHRYQGWTPTRQGRVGVDFLGIRRSQERQIDGEVIELQREAAAAANAAASVRAARPAVMT